MEWRIRMKLWMKMSAEAYENFIQEGTFYMDEKCFRGANEQYAYNWIGKELVKKEKRPSRMAKYPIMTWYQMDGKKHLKEILLPEKDRNSIVLLVEIPDKEVLLFDERLFHYIKNYFYIPLDESDFKRFELALEKLNLNEYKMRIRSADYSAAACMRRMIEESWSRVFDLKKEDGYIYGLNSRKSIQAAIWKVSLHQVKTVYSFNKLHEMVQVS